MRRKRMEKKINHKKRSNKEINVENIFKMKKKEKKKRKQIYGDGERI